MTQQFDPPASANGWSWFSNGLSLHLGVPQLQTHPLCSLGTPTGEAPFYRPMGVSQPIRNVMSLADQGWALRFCGRLIFGVKWSVTDSNWKKIRKPNANRKEANPHSLWNDFQYLWTVTAIKTRLPAAATWSTTDGLQFYNVHQFGCFGHAQQNDWRRSLSKRPSRTAAISSTGGTSWARNNSDHHAITWATNFIEIPSFNYSAWNNH